MKTKDTEALGTENRERNLTKPPLSSNNAAPRENVKISKIHSVNSSHIIYCCHYTLTGAVMHLVK